MLKKIAFLYVFITSLHAVDKPFVIVVPSYNNSTWYTFNLNSIFQQTYPYYHVLYIDDCSLDDTADLVEAYVTEHAWQEKITIIRNNAQHGMLANLYAAVQSCPDDVIILILDGDDWLAHNDVLAYLNEVYQDDTIWITYGQFVEYPSGKQGFCSTIPTYIINANAYRLYDWVSSHLKTFYAGLFKQIPKHYFIRNGSFLKSAGDCATMFALLELGGNHSRFINNVLYVYNTHNTASVFRTRPLEQLRNMYWVRNQEPLKPTNYYAHKGLS